MQSCTCWQFLALTIDIRAESPVQRNKKRNMIIWSKIRIYKNQQLARPIIYQRQTGNDRYTRRCHNGVTAFYSNQHHKHISRKESDKRAYRWRGLDTSEHVTINLPIYHLISKLSKQHIHIVFLDYWTNTLSKNMISSMNMGTQA